MQCSLNWFKTIWEPCDQLSKKEIDDILAGGGGGGKGVGFTRRLPSFWFSRDLQESNDVRQLEAKLGIGGGFSCSNDRLNEQSCRRICQVFVY
jgi:hypothetical protein